MKAIISILLCMNLMLVLNCFAQQDKKPKKWDTYYLKSRQKYYKKQYKESLLLANKAFSFAKKNFGEGHPKVMATMNVLAMNYSALKQYKQAGSFLEKIYEVHKRNYGESNPKILPTIINLASCYSFQKKYKESQKLGDKALSIAKKAYGEDSPKTLNIINNLGFIKN